MSHVMLISTMSQKWYLVHRVNFHNHLKKRALETATLHTRCKITAIHISSPRPSLTLDDGRTVDADVLLGADGLHV
jgi:salicylate hydroxylase